MTSKKIAIIGGSLWGNRGAAAMLETTIAKMREMLPGVEISVFTPYPEKDQSLSIDPTLVFHDSRPLALIQYFLMTVWSCLRGFLGLNTSLKGGAEALTTPDLLLDIGGITFADGRLKFLPYNILTIWPSLIYQIPVVKLSQAAGSFNNPLLRVVAKYFLSRCEHIFARGEKTWEYLIDLGLKKDRVTLAADIAFSYQSAYCLTRENELAVEQLSISLDRKISTGQKLICISPSILVSKKMGSTKKSYNDLILDIIKKSDYKNETYIFLPNATREGSKKTRNNDLQVIKGLRDQAELELPARIYRKIIWVDYDLSSKGVGEIIQQTDIVIASRFHTMVAALRSFKPTLIVGWGHKYKEVMKRFGQQEFVFNYQLNTKQILDKLNKLLNREDEITAQIKEAFVIERRASSIQFDHIAGLIIEN
jgi:polysaccharide pyruvyl transferase WcaK-like protein